MWSCRSDRLLIWSFFLQRPETFHRIERLNMDTRPSPPPSLEGGGLSRALLGMMLVIAGFVSYMFLLDQYWIRTWGIPNTGLMCVGTYVAWMASRRRPRWAGITAGLLTSFLTVFFVLIMYVIQPPPAQGPKTDSLSLASLTTPLLDHMGKSISLAEYAGKGPVLLIFYRGHW